jgi:hypothetical protein
MSNTEESKEKKKCRYSYGDYHCPFDAKKDKELCIFHLPVDEKNEEEFWKNFANYFIILIEKDKKLKNHYDFQTDFETAVKLDRLGKLPKRFWIYDKKDESLYVDYSNKVINESTWEFVGFQFLKMDDRYNFRDFIFPSVDFSSAQFSHKADFIKVEFSGKANFDGAEFLDEVDFSGAKFLDDVFFSMAQFSGKTNFKQVQFSGTADFWMAQFSHEVCFGSAQFSGTADFSEVEFSEKADFNNVEFSSKADFSEVDFLGEVDFNWAQFLSKADFWFGTIFK